jgi:hypothetical protein
MLLCFIIIHDTPKMLAVLECLSALAFIYWFFNKGRDFNRATTWRPIANIHSKRIVDRHASVFSKKEIYQIFESFKIDKRRTDKFFASTGIDASGVISYDVLLAGLRAQKGNSIDVNKVRKKDGDRERYSSIY